MPEPSPESEKRPAEGLPSDLPSLEEFLIECQKSLSRVARSSSEASKADSEFVRGERPSYSVDGITFKISAGIQIGQSKVWAGSPRIQLDFNAAPEERSQLEFRVESRPMEIVTGAKLEIANLDPLGDDLPLLKLRVWLINDRGQPVVGYRLKLHFLVAGAKKAISFDIGTDATGRCDFFIDPYEPEKQLKIVGVRKRETVHLRHSGRGHGDDEFYVWATCDRDPAWHSIVEPATTETSLPMDKPPELPDEMSSERIRIRIPSKSMKR